MRDQLNPGFCLVQDVLFLGTGKWMNGGYVLALVTYGPDISIAAANGRVMKIVIAAQFAEGSGVLTQGELQKLSFR